MLRRVWRQRGLTFTLTRRQYELRYRQSLVGVLWALIAPLGTLAVATLVFGKVLEVPTGGAPYPLFALSALLPWGFFAGSLTTGVQSVTQGGALLTRFAFPRAVLPLSTVGVGFIDLVVSAALFLIVLVVSGESMPVTAFWVFPLLVVETFLVVAVVLLTSAVNVFARDVKLFVPIALQLLLFVTPVMYSLESVPDYLRPWFRLNPMAGLVESFRSVLVYGTAPALGDVVPAIVGAVALFLVGTWYFGATEARFADVI